MSESRRRTAAAVPPPGPPPSAGAILLEEEQEALVDNLREDLRKDQVFWSKVLVGVSLGLIALLAWLKLRVMPALIPSALVVLAAGQLALVALSVASAAGFDGWANDSAAADERGYKSQAANGWIRALVLTCKIGAPVPLFYCLLLRIEWQIALIFVLNPLQTGLVWYAAVMNEQVRQELTALDKLKYDSKSA